MLFKGSAELSEFSSLPEIHDGRIRFAEERHAHYNQHRQMYPMHEAIEYFQSKTKNRLLPDFEEQRTVLLDNLTKAVMKHNPDVSVLVLVDFMDEIFPAVERDEIKQSLERLQSRQED